VFKDIEPLLYTKQFLYTKEAIEKMSEAEASNKVNK